MDSLRKCIFDSRVGRCRRKNKKILIPTACTVGWTQIPEEGSTYLFSDQVDVAYGTAPYDLVNGTYKYINNITGIIVFNDTFFGGENPSPPGSKGFYRCYAPLARVAIPGLSNTGRSVNGFRGDNDPNYVLISTPQPISTPRPVKVAWSENWLIQSGFSRWVGFGDSFEYPVGVILPGLNKIQATFNLTGFDPKTASITLQFMVDDSLEDVFLNYKSQGFTQGKTLLDYPPEPFIINSGFKTGINTLSFLWRNTNTPLDPPDDLTLPTGIRARVSGTAVPYALSNTL